MVLISVLCPHCHSDQVIKGGKTKTGQQRYKGICKIKLSQLPWYPPDNHRLEVPTWN